MLGGEEAYPVSNYLIFRGASGAEYSYMPLSRAPLLKGRSGNYVLARSGEGGWEIVSAGEAVDLGTAAWPEPSGHEMVLIRFNVSRSAREAELTDLVSVADRAAEGLRATG
jgi:hypothetical protein